jgi:hypothetical protein
MLNVVVNQNEVHLPFLWTSPRVLTRTTLNLDWNRTRYSDRHTAFQHLLYRGPELLVSVDVDAEVGGRTDVHDVNGRIEQRRVETRSRPEVRAQDADQNETEVG